MRRISLATLLACLASTSAGVTAQDTPPATAGDHPHAPAPALARTHGRLVDEAGAPIAEAVLLMRAVPAPTAQAQGTAPPVAPPWPAPQPVVTGADGRFELGFEVREGYQFRLELQCPSREQRGWRWRSLAPGAELALGDVVLRPAASLVVHVVDEDGALLTDGWVVRARPLELPPDSDPAVWPVAARIDPATGSCRLTGLPQSWITIDATTHGLEAIPPQRIELAAATDNTLELVYTGPKTRDLLCVALQPPPGCSSEPVPGAVRAVGPDGVVVALERHQGPTHFWTARPSVAGPATVVVDDPRFLPVKLEHVGVGLPVRATLVGSASLVLAVVDADDGKPVRDHGLAVQYHSGPPRGPHTLYAPGLRGVAASQPIALVPGEVTLFVSSPRHPSTVVRLAPLGPGEVRTVEVTLGAPRPLLGQVVDTAGAPVAGAVVLLTRGTVHGHDEAEQTVKVVPLAAGSPTPRVQVPYRDLRVVTGADGTFSVAGLAPGTWAAHVSDGPFVHGTDVRVLAPGHDEADPWRLVLPEATTATFALEGLAGRDPRGFTLNLYPDDTTPAPLRPPAHLVGSPTGGLTLAADAAGRFGPVRVPLGAQRLGVVEARPVGPSTKRVNAWSGTVDVTRDLVFALALGRR